MPPAFIIVILEIRGEKSHTKMSQTSFLVPRVVWRTQNFIQFEMFSQKLFLGLKTGY